MSRVRWTVGAVVVLGAVAAAVRLLDDAAPVRVEREAVLMGTGLRVVAEAPERSAALDATEAVFREVGRVEQFLSSWDPGSELSRLNQAPVGAARTPDAELMSLLAEAERWAAATDRAFEPVVGALVDAWNLRGEGRRPSAAELERALAATGPGGMEIDPEAGTVVRNRGAAWIDAGGFGKGAALRAARRVLEGRDGLRVLLDFGGQALALADDGDEPWVLAVAHPSRRAEGSGELRIRNGSVATSGTSERFITVEGERLGHILDPRDGRPVSSWGSVTVVGSDPVATDALSTALYVLGPEQGMAWARDRADLGVLFVEETSEGLRSTWNDAMEAWLVRPPGSPSATESQNPSSTRDPKGTEKT